MSEHQMTWVLVALASLWALVAPALGQEDPGFHVVASRVAIVRAEASTGSAALARMNAGDVAACFADPGDPENPEQRNGLYHVRLPDGRKGWVSKYRVRPSPGPAPGFVPEIGEDPTEATARDFHLAVGAPQGYIELVNEGYIVGYDMRLKIPAWVQYRVTKAQVTQTTSGSPDFEPDTRIPQPGRALLTDYDGAASWDLWQELGMEPARNPNSTLPLYARGHMAPARDLSRTGEIKASTYTLSNIAPQIQSSFNSGIWSGLEELVRGWVETRGDLTIITGPVFLSSVRQIDAPRWLEERLAQSDDVPVKGVPPTERQVIYNVVGVREVAVPTAFFKVVVDNSDASEPDVLAFLVAHRKNTDDRPVRERVAEMLVSVDEIERLTGLDLLTGYESDLQEVIESDPAEGIWD